MQGFIRREGTRDIPPNIFPPLKFYNITSELQLKKTTECGTQLSYLDILITIENGKYSTAVYDKRDNFNFNIVNFHIFLLTSHLDLLMEFIFPS